MQLVIVGHCDSIYFILEGISYDGVVTERIVAVHVAVTVIFSLLAVLGIGLSIVCITWNLIHRNER